MKKLIILTVLAAFILPTESCKKGEGDPFISFHSRKARIVGKWTLKSQTRTVTSTSKIPSVVTSTTTYTYDGSNMSKKTATATQTYPYSETFTFEKDGSFSGSTTDDGVTDTYEGNWNFTSKIGKDRKNKDQLVLYITKYTTSGTTFTYTGDESMMIFDIYQLKNKEIILKTKVTTDDPSNSDSEELESTYDVGK